MKDPNYNDLKNSERFYSEVGLFDKIAKYVAKAGKHVIYRSVLLYVALISSKTPIVYKGIITGALGYFISPLDLVPDVLFGVGFVDDLAALTIVLRTLAQSDCLNKEDREKAKRMMIDRNWCSISDMKDLDEF